MNFHKLNPEQATECSQHPEALLAANPTPSPHPTHRITIILTSNTTDEFCLFSYLISVESYSMCLFVSGLFCSTRVWESQPCRRVQHCSPVRMAVAHSMLLIGRDAFIHAAYCPWAFGSSLVSSYFS